MKALFDYKGERREGAAPGDPIEILGFDKPPAAGELARVVANDREAREIANRRGERVRREQLASVVGGGVSLEGLYYQLQAGEVSDLNLSSAATWSARSRRSSRSSRSSRTRRRAEGDPPGRGGDHQNDSCSRPHPTP